MEVEKFLIESIDGEIFYFDKEIMIKSFQVISNFSQDFSGEILKTTELNSSDLHSLMLLLNDCYLYRNINELNRMIYMCNYLCASADIYSHIIKIINTQIFNVYDENYLVPILRKYNDIELNEKDDILKNLIKLSASHQINYLENKCDVTPLLMALFRDLNSDIIKLLLIGGADVNPLTTTHQHKPLWILFKYCRHYRKKEEILDLLLQYGADINCLGNGRFTLLMEYSCSGDTNMVYLLLKHGADTNVQVYGFNTALMSAIEHHYFEIIKLLIKYGAALNIQKYDGTTEIIMAVNHCITDKNITIFQTLIENGASLFYFTKDGDNALLKCLKKTFHCNESDLIYFLKKNAQSFTELPNYRIIGLLVGKADYITIRTYNRYGSYDIKRKTLINQIKQYNNILHKLKIIYNHPQQYHPKSLRRIICIL